MLVIPVWLFWAKRPSDGTQIPGRTRQQPSADANMALGHGVHWKWYLLAVPWRTLFGYPMRSWVHQDLGIVPSSQPCKRFSISITSMIIIISCCFLLGRGFLDCLVFTILGFVFVTASIPLRVDIYSQMFDSTTPHIKRLLPLARTITVVSVHPLVLFSLSQFLQLLHYSFYTSTIMELTLHFLICLLVSTCGSPLLRLFVDSVVDGKQGKAKQGATRPWEGIDGQKSLGLNQEVLWSAT